MDTQNSKTVSNDVNTMMTRATNIFNAIETVVSTMSDKQNIRVEDLAIKVAKIVDVDVKAVIGYVNDFGKNTSGGYIDRGAHGGYIRGTKKVKTVKAGKKTV